MKVYSKYGLVPQGVYVREQDLTFEYAARNFAEKDISFGDRQKQSFGLIRPDGRYTNLALILSDQCPYTTKAAIFEGTNKDKFKDRKEFTGSLFNKLMMF